MTEQKNKYSEYIRILWLGAILALLLVAVLFVYIAKTKLPETESLENPQIELATEILDRNGKQLGKAFKLNREWITYEELNPHLVDALVSTEDERYFEHSGIDLRSFVRAVVFLGSKGGASTITQQLAKQFFTKRSKSFGKRVWQKLREWVIAIEFEKRYTKGEIIAMYLNKFDFWYGANGVSAAASTYFNKDQKDLSIPEAAMLIGMLKNPNLYNPNKNPNNAQNRRNVVLRQMIRNGKYSDIQYQKIKEEPVDMTNFRREKNYTGIAPYFRAELLKDVRKILSQERYAKADGTKYNLYTDGLTINTTIDMYMQRHAEAAMMSHMKDLQGKLFRQWKGQDPWTYKADAAQKKQRLGNLNSQIRSSERFQKLRKQYLGKISGEITSNIKNARLLDADIFKLFEAEKNKKYLDGLIAKEWISKRQAAVYREILKSPYWPKLRKKWKDLKWKSDKVFKTKVKMEVFDYNREGYKTVVMTPKDSIRYHNMHLQLGSVALDPRTGEVKTWVGGVNHKYNKYDHIRSNRQVGSTFKPFIYTTAISDLAMSPCQKIKDVQYTIVAGDRDFGLSKSWSPANSNNKFSGQDLTLMEGLKQSKNSVSVKLMKEIGNVQRVKNFTANLGIAKEKVPDYPSICLGTPELSVLEMAGAYTAFANNGCYVKPVFIRSIVDKNGKTIYTGETEKRKVINPSYNYAMVEMLKYAASFVSGKVKSELGGKTGTTDDYKNGWFVGITPELVIATWVGGDQEWIRFQNITYGQGAVMARPYCVNLLQRIERDTRIDYNPNARFAIPENQFVEINCNKYDEMTEQDRLKEEEAKKVIILDEFEEEF